MHTYLNEPDEFNYESDRYDDEDEGHEDENNVLESSRHATSCNANIGDAATTIRQPQRSISPKDRAATLENDERSDADTYEDSTIADSITYKSAVDVDDDFRSEDFFIFIYVVNAVAATLGGLFGVAQASKSGNKTVVRSTRW